MVRTEVVKNIVAEHPEVDWTEAPDWATFAGRDEQGWHWFDHQPHKFSDHNFVKGCLGDKGYPVGKHGFLKHQYKEGGELLVVPRPPAIQPIQMLLDKAEKAQAEVLLALARIEVLKAELATIDQTLLSKYKVKRVV